MAGMHEDRHMAGMQADTDRNSEKEIIYQPEEQIAFRRLTFDPPNKGGFKQMVDFLASLFLTATGQRLWWETAIQIPV